MENESLISKPQKASEVHALNDKNYHTIFDFIADAIFIQDISTGRIIDVNDAMIKMYGYASKDEVLKKNIGNLSAGIDRYDDITAMAHIQRTINEGPQTFDWMAKRKDGHTFWVEMKLRKINIEGTEWILAIGRDISRRKKLEVELIKAEEKFRHIVELSTRGMYFYELQEDGRLILTGANPSADQIIGIDHQDMIGRPIEEIFPDLIQTNVPSLYKMIAKGEKESAQFDIEYHSGQISGFYNVHVFQTEKNCITVNFTDITERKNIEIKLEEQARELREISIMKDKFMSIIAHDLKSPFNAIIGFADLIIKHLDQLDKEELLQGVTTIHNASTHIFKLLENLLTWAQNQSGKINFSPEILNLRKQILKTISTIESVAKNKSISIKMNIDNECRIFADENMFDTVIRNLVSNAIKYSFKGTEITITATETDQQVQISIADQGVGINPERLSAIFEIDKRSNTTGTDNEQGTGFGLILCKEFINRHQGKIWVESTPGVGSIFTFSLPKH
jgi:PAS domain S-box-containing protein